MAWTTVIDAESDQNPATKAIQRRLATAIRKAIESRSELRRIEISRRAGRKGWASTGKAIECDESDEDLSPEDGAASLIELAEAWAEENGAARLCFVLLGQNKHGNTVEIERVQWNLTRDDADDEDPNVLDVLREVRRGLNDAITANGKLLDNMGQLAANVVGMLDVARQQGMVVVEAKKVEIEAEKWRIEQEYKARDADRDADISKERMKHGVAVVGMAADGFLATMNKKAAEAAAKAGAKAEPVNRGDAQRAGLAKIFESLSDEEKAKAHEAVGDDVWDLFQAALKESDENKRKGILRKVRETFEGWPKEVQNKRGTDLAAAIGMERATMLKMILAGATV